MKNRILVITLIALLILSSIPVMAGNGAPNGPHFNLNIIGVKNPKNEDMDQTAGHVIFVNLNKPSQIKLFNADETNSEAPYFNEADGSFKVLDKNGTDSDGAAFQLPKPGFDPYIIGQDMTDVDVTSDYTVFVRPLGKPGGWASITTCADLMDSNIMDFLPNKDVRTIEALNREGLFGGYASIEQVGQDVTLRTTGKNKKGFTDVTAELTSIVLALELYDEADVLLDTIMLRVPIFDDMLANEYWEYDNHGLKLLQVRFYGHNGVEDDGIDVTLDDGDLVMPTKD